MEMTGVRATPWRRDPSREKAHGAAAGAIPQTEKFAVCWGRERRGMSLERRAVLPWSHDGGRCSRQSLRLESRGLGGWPQEGGHSFPHDEPPQRWAQCHFAMQP